MWLNWLVWLVFFPPHIICCKFHFIKKGERKLFKEKLGFGGGREKLANVCALFLVHNLKEEKHTNVCALFFDS